MENIFPMKQEKKISEAQKGKKKQNRCFHLKNSSKNKDSSLTFL